MGMPILKKIELPITSNDKRIVEGRHYLVRAGWKIQNDPPTEFFDCGRAEMQWYGWNFQFIYPAGAQYNYDCIKELFELTDPDKDFIICPECGDEPDKRSYCLNKWHNNEENAIWKGQPKN